MPDDHASLASPDKELEQGIALAKNGDKVGARTILRRIIGREPGNEQAWLWLAWVADTKAASQRILREARVFVPNSEAIREGLEWSADTSEPVSPPKAYTSLASLHQAGERIERRLQQTRDSGQRIGSWFSRLRRILSDRWSAIAAWLAGLPLPSRRNAYAAAASLLTAIALVAIVALGIRNARNQPQVILALELPTAVVEATATPTTRQLVAPLWIQVQVAITQSNRSRVVEYLDDIRTIDPENERARQDLATAYYHLSMEALEKDDLTSAQACLNHAVRLDADDKQMQSLRHKVEVYLDGLDLYKQQAWQETVTQLGRVYDQDPTFRDTAPMLAKAHYQLGLIKQAEAQVIRSEQEGSNSYERWDEEEILWREAEASFERSVALHPELDDAQVRLGQVRDILVPPDRIHVSISRKIATVYQDNQVIYSFYVCTGRASSPTIPGRYKIKTKMDSAYGSAWDLDMPYWLGIYDAGGSENGFHALPILSSGVTLWRSALGTGCSYGCIVLDTPDALALYEWADLGTDVIIDY